MRRLFLLGMLAHACSVFASTTWTLEAALRAALATHPLIESRRASEEAARAERAAAEWQRYPTPSLEMAQQSSGGGGFLLRVDQPIWTGGKITADIDSAKQRERASHAFTLEAHEEVALKVIDAIVEIARQQARARHAAQSVNAHEKLLNMIRRRVQQEVSPVSDQRLAESRLFASLGEMSAIEQQRRAALTQLSQLVNGQVDAVDVASIEASVKDLPEQLDQVLSDALTHAPVLQRIMAEIDAASAEIKSRRASFLPHLYLRLERKQGDTSDVRAMLVLQAQPGAGLSALSGIDAALARRNALIAQRNALEREIKERLSLDWNEARVARERVEIAEQVRSTASEVAESYARQYTAGRKTWLDVLNAVRESAHAEMALADARAQMWRAALRIKLWTKRLPLAAHL